MIVVVGRLSEQPDSAPSAEAIAQRVAGADGRVEVVAVAPDGPGGDAILGRLAEAGIGHAATRRSSGPMLEPADLELALRYLPDVRVIVLTADAGHLEATAAGAAAWSGAALIVLRRAAEAPRGNDGSDGAAAALEQDGAIVLEGPARDPDGAFAGVVATLALRLDTGEAPQVAWRRVTADLGVDEVSRSSGPVPGRPPG